MLRRHVYVFYKSLGFLFKLQGKAFSRTALKWTWRYRTKFITNFAIYIPLTFMAKVAGTLLLNSNWPSIKRQMEKKVQTQMSFERKTLIDSQWLFDLKTLATKAADAICSFEIRINRRAGSTMPPPPPPPPDASQPVDVLGFNISFNVEHHSQYFEVDNLSSSALHISTISRSTVNKNIALHSSKSFKAGRP